MPFHIYKFLNADQTVIYVGITANLQSRIRAQHFTRNGHLPAECYKQTSIVLYSECASETDARIKERYLINKLTPAFNVKMNKGDAIPWPIEDFDWKYIGFDNERVHTFSPGGRKRRSKADSQSLRHILGSEVQYDLSSAVRPSPFAGTIWLDAAAVEKLGLCWHKYGRDLCQSYLDMTIHEHMVSFVSYLHESDNEKPIGRLFTLAGDEGDQPESKRNPVLQSRGLSCRKWIVVSTDFKPFDVRVRQYSEAEQLAIALEARLDAFKNAIITPDGWTVVPAVDDDFFMSDRPAVYSKEYWDLCESLGTHPGFSLFEDGKFQHGHHMEMPRYVKEFAKYQQQLKAKAGVYVYASNELNGYIANHKKLIRQLVPLPARPGRTDARSTHASVVDQKLNVTILD